VRLLLAASFVLTSPAFHANGAIPRAYTCDGKDTSPPLRWTSPPRPTRSLALRVYDADARFTHWLAWDIPAGSRGLAAGRRPPRQGRNDFGRAEYSGPCPPKGAPHHYVFTLYALAKPLTLRTGSSAFAFVTAVARSRIVGHAQLTGTYRRR
jgi:Raf kinase inhibitor-like YbhB/YbcL family protein